MQDKGYGCRREDRAGTRALCSRGCGRKIGPASPALWILWIRCGALGTALKCIAASLPTFAIPAARRSTCGLFDTALARKPPQRPPDIGKLRDRALRISSDGPVGPRLGTRVQSGAVFGAGASNSVAYQRNHPRSRRPTNAPAAERQVGCQHALQALAGGLAIPGRGGRGPARLGRVRRGASSCADRTRARTRVMASMPGATRVPAMRSGDDALAVEPSAGRPGLDVSSHRRLTCLRPTTVCCGRAPRKFSLS
jgi:hypothetical protein